MQTESRTYRKGHMLALPVAKPRAKAGQGERSGRNREDRRQLSDHVPTTEVSTRHAPCHSPHSPLAPQGLGGMSPYR